MGYTTDFTGGFSVSPPLKPAHRDYLNAFANTRRMKRDEQSASALPDPLREAVDLPIGPDGSYFTGGKGFLGQEHDDSILEYNCPPATQPGLWCHWQATDDGAAIMWDDSEKFYYYTEWIRYLIDHFLRPWGYTLDGDVYWYGEDRDDNGIIRISDNEVSELYGRIEYS